ncbi:MAG: isoprenyl transferase [Planctomycetaceae bacterium]|nr:isoprenyl transferase [Planctomycetaceae bacterium]
MESTTQGLEQEKVARGEILKTAPATEAEASRSARVPRHVAIIMDGNGRWARRRGLPRIEGHRRGVRTVRNIVDECASRGLDQLTLYCFSSENWRRPEGEQRLLMRLLKQYLVEERRRIVSQGLRFRMIGRRGGLPEDVLAEIDKTERLAESNRGMRLCLAVNYGSRAEITDAVRHLAERVAAGVLKPEQIDEQLLSDSLNTGGMPDPDLVIRTAGEMRLSNFLLWQISYAELWVTKRHWPEFTVDDLRQAFDDYASRDRRFGGLSG